MSCGHTNAYVFYFDPSAQFGEAVNKDTCSICSGEMLKDSSGNHICPKQFCRDWRMTAQRGRPDLFLVKLFGPSVVESELYKSAMETLASKRRWLQ